MSVGKLDIIYILKIKMLIGEIQNIKNLKILHFMTKMKNIQKKN